MEQIPKVSELSPDLSEVLEIEPIKIQEGVAKRNQ